MNTSTRVRDFLVGIEYHDPFDHDDSRGHLTLRRKVSIVELAEEIQLIMTLGSTCPQFPPEAYPSVTYAYDLDNKEDSDCYHEIMLELERHNREEVIY
jgi:hypothetical protein